MENDDSKCAHDTGQIINPAFDNLYKKYQNAVFGFAYYLTQNRGDAEDLFQEAWLRIAKKLLDEVNMKSIRAWIFTIVEEGEQLVSSKGWTDIWRAGQHRNRLIRDSISANISLFMATSAI
jgi:hypothetical protein